MQWLWIFYVKFWNNLFNRFANAWRAWRSRWGGETGHIYLKWFLRRFFYIDERLWTCCVKFWTILFNRLSLLKFGSIFVRISILKFWNEISVLKRNMKQLDFKNYFKIPFWWFQKIEPLLSDLPLHTAGFWDIRKPATKMSLFCRKKTCTATFFYRYFFFWKIFFVPNA